MFLLALGGSLILGAGLLAAASFSEGALVALRTAALSIGWLFVLATIAGLAGLRHSTFGRLGAAAITFVSGLTLLYVSYFPGDEIREEMRDEIRGPVLDAPIRHAVPALPAHEPVYKATLASMEFVMPVATKEIPPEAKPVARKTVDCTDKLGLAWIVCQERTRLEYCEGREDEATCPSAIPYSPPG